MINFLKKSLGLACILSGLAPQILIAQQASNAEIAKQLANPVAALISVPFQLNYDRGIGPENGTRTTLNIQPVVPFELNSDWNLISRTILPIIHQKDVAGSSGSQFGLGDTLQSFFFSPRNPTSGGWLWGAGPAMLFPTATDDLLGAEQWAAGPTFVALRQNGPWTFGGLTNHLWSFAGSDSKPDVNQTFLQPFLSYTTPDAWQYLIQSETTYNWESEEWGIPIMAGIGKTVNISGQTVSFSGQVKYWADPAPGGPDDISFRFVTNFAFPK